MFIKALHPTFLWVGVRIKVETPQWKYTAILKWLGFR
jgi:hypothetical protein